MKIKNFFKKRKKQDLFKYKIYKTKNNKFIVEIENAISFERILFSYDTKKEIEYYVKYKIDNLIKDMKIYLYDELKERIKKL